MKKLLLAIATVLAFSIPAWAAVDINNASQAELEAVKGIGPKKAQAIVDYRKKHGPFKSADDLDKVPGFGKKSVEKVKKEITVGNPKAAAAGTTAESKTVKEASDKTRTVGNETAAAAGKTAGTKTVKETTDRTVAGHKVDRAVPGHKAEKETKTGKEDTDKTVAGHKIEKEAKPDKEKGSKK